MKQVLKSTGAKGTATQLYQQWMGTFGDGDCNIDPNSYGLVCPRAPELKLASVDPIDPASKVQFKPVGVFNRFDLAPKNGATCGEYRIVYAMSSTDPNIHGRGLYIFEAALPNPDPTKKLVGCLQIAEFWQNLSNLTTSQIATQLEKFYYLGTAIPGVGPVVDAKNYGLASNGGAYTAGQIRSNMFIDSNQWALREFKTDLTCPPDGGACTLAIDHVSVKNNPANVLFDGTHRRAPGFLKQFPANVVPLASSDVSTIGMSTATQFDTYESISLPEGRPGETKVDYNREADADLKAAIQSVIDSKQIPLTVDQILLRAETQTCAGCHQLSVGADLGGGLRWPGSRGFVQIDEGSVMSDALISHFLPHRKDVLEAFINKHCGGGGTDELDDGLTVGGSPDGAAN
jgi:hypothetical protein